MFATIVGALPGPPDASTEPDRMRAQLAAQADAGLELLSFAEPEPPGDDLVSRWRAAARIADGLGGGAVKAAMLGPYSLAHGQEADAPIDLTRATIVTLLDAGCPYVEVHEPVVTRIGEDPRARPAFVRIQQALTDGLDGHLCLAIVGGDADAAGPATIFAAGYRSYLFDLIEGPENWRLVVAAPPDVGIVAGALDHRAGKHEVPETVVWAARYAASTGGRGTERVGVSTAGSLGALTWDGAIARLDILGRAARAASLEGEDLARALDPRAVDIRSAALGRYAPLRPPSRGRRARPGAPGV